MRFYTASDGYHSYDGVLTRWTAGSVSDAQKVIVGRKILALDMPEVKKHEVLRGFHRGDLSQGDLLKILKEYAVKQEDSRSLNAALSGYKRRFPDAIIIGCKKCGTTFFKRVLAQHPYIAMRPDESKFFYDADDDEKRKVYLKRAMARSFPDQITMVKEPTLLYFDDAPQFVRKVNSRAKLILLVRDPVCRLASDFFMGQRRGTIDVNVTFDELILDDKYKKKRNRLMTQSLLDERIQLWLTEFSLDRFLIIKNEDLLTSKFATILHDTERFLEIPHSFQLQRNSSTTCARNWINGSLICSPLRQSSPVCSYEERFKDVFAMLKEVFRPHVSRFESLVHRKFNWF